MFTCGFAQEAGAQHLRSAVSANRFLSPEWYDSLTMASSNPAMQGFFTEQMLLSYISRTGCPPISDEFQKQPKSTTGPKPDFRGRPSDGFTLYILAFNFRAVDAIMVNINRRTDEAIVVGVQITISGRHTDDIVTQK